MMFILRIIISILIVCTTGYIGIYKSKKLQERETILREMITFLRNVENEIQYMKSILPNAIEASRQSLTSKLKFSLGLIVMDMLESNDTTNISTSISTNIDKIDSLTTYDKNIFISTLKNLGVSDIEGQLNIIGNSINIIESQLKEANDIKINNSKLYKTVGVIAGIMIVIICI